MKNDEKKHILSIVTNSRAMIFSWCVGYIVWLTTNSMLTGAIAAICAISFCDFIITIIETIMTNKNAVYFHDPLAENYTIDQKTILVELEAHREFYKSVYHYVGNYPVWKVQQEFRELIGSLNPDSEFCLWHFHNLDAYLGKVVNETDKLRKYYDSSYSHGHGWGEHLPNARGDHLLEGISKKHPKFQKHN
jgi:hypothetical protein